MEILRPPALSLPEKFADRAMLPIMRVLGGFRDDSVQETHPWHVHEIDPRLVREAIGVVKTTGATDESMRGRYLFGFHAPGWGGWKHYSLLSADEAFHPGWITRPRNDMTRIGQAAVNSLLVVDGVVRMLNGPSNMETTFFAVNRDGYQIPMRLVGQGRLGDNQFPGTRLL